MSARHRISFRFCYPVLIAGLVTWCPHQSHLRLVASSLIRSFSAHFPRQILSLKFVTMVLGCLLLTSCSKHTGLDETVKQLVFKTLNGEKITLKNQAGPTLINFWSTSCVVCINEMPHLAELYEEFDPNGFELIAVAMPYDRPSDVLQLSQQLDLPFPIALDLHGEAVDAFASVVGTPTSYLISGDGYLVKRYVGAIDLNNLRNELNVLLEAS